MQFWYLFLTGRGHMGYLKLVYTFVICLKSLEYRERLIEF